ncbi:MAG: preprotein translocase subunit SecG [Candidatus Kerfeldbacteria bacterium]|nr:preprotein translocase subunit SecG [Candidatus Kerfeldbacteria bacterium]
MDVKTIISVVQIIVVGLLITTVLLQQKGVGLSSSFGGGDSVYTTRRGPEKFIFYSSIVLSGLFLSLGLAAFFLN